MNKLLLIFTVVLHFNLVFSFPQESAITPETNDTKDAYKISTEKCQEYNKDILCIIESKISSNGKTYFHKLSGPMPYPHMAAIGYNEDLENVIWNCGGTLISEKYVLTAAQCVNTEKHGIAQWVRLGVLKLSAKDAKDENPKNIRIVKRIVHPDYKPSKFNNDIALLELESEVKFNPYIKPACLYTKDKIPENVIDYAVITGWGENLPGSRKSNLLYGVVSFLDDKECKDNYANDALLANGYDAQTMICAADKKTPTGPCDGDGGGPIQIPNPENACTWAQVGVMSDLRCGKTNPILYIKVLPYISWIQQIVWP